MRRLPCLERWQRELATGDRTKTTFDALQRAASAEASAREWYEIGIPGLAEKELRRAAEIILEEAA
jgi:hypothetical protein